MYCDHTFEYADALLRRNWFLDMESLHEMISELPEDVYCEVLQHRNEYAATVRWALHEPEIPQRFVRTSVRDMSNAEWNGAIAARDEERTRRMRAHRAAFQPPPRPREDIDDAVDDAKAEMDECRERLDATLCLAKKTQKYVVPSMRAQLGNDIPVVRSARARFELVENGFKRLGEHLAASNKIWTDLMWIDVALRDAAKRPSFLTSVPAPAPSV